MPFRPPSFALRRLAFVLPVAALGACAGAKSDSVEAAATREPPTFEVRSQAPRDPHASQRPPSGIGLNPRGVHAQSLIWAGEQELLPSDLWEFDSFAHSASIDGDLAVVGAPDHRPQSSTSASPGAVYVYAWNGSAWAQDAELGPSDQSYYESLGYSVSLSGTTLIAGAYNDNSAGSASIYVRGSAGWTVQQEMTPPPGEAGQFYGYAVAVSGETAAIVWAGDARGTETYGVGSVFVWVRANGAWALQQELVSPNGTSELGFGSGGVAIAGDTLVVGTTYTPAGIDAVASAAYVFTRTNGVWNAGQGLVSLDKAANDGFGGAVAVATDTIVVGAPHVLGGDGAAYTFTSKGGIWTEQQELVAADGADGDQFGSAVAVQGDTVLVGAPLHFDRQAKAGTTYVFQQSGGAWTQTQELKSLEGNAGESFGSSVALSAQNALVGADTDPYPTSGVSAGAAYVFDLKSMNGDGCTNAATCASGFCVEGVCCSEACGVCGACTVATGATSDGTCTPRAPGTTCRAAAGTCDIAEACNGLTVSCPRDVLVAGGTVCHAAVDVCDTTDTCTGSSASCPPHAVAPSTRVCRPGAGPCDLGARCDGAGTSCPASVPVPAGVVCGTAAGACATAPACDGADPACPKGGFQPVGTVCRPAAGPCDLAETCTGAANCPPDVRAPSGDVCRPSAGSCDVQEACDGTEAACPPDGFEPSGAPCGAAPGVCEAAATCSGGAPLCPPPVAENGAPCDGGVCSAGVCGPRPDAGGESGADAGGDSGAVRDGGDASLDASVSSGNEDGSAAGEDAESGSPAIPDSGERMPDAATVAPTGPTATGSGCGCTVIPPASSSRSTWIPVLAGLGFVGARRRRRAPLRA